MTVTITVSEPYTKIAGSASGMRPTGRRRTYRANVLGRDYVNENKSEIQSVIRAAIRREEDAARFVHVPVVFEFIREDQAAT